MNFIEVFLMIGMAIAIVCLGIITWCCYRDYLDDKYYSLHPEKRPGTLVLSDDKTDGREENGN